MNVISVTKESKPGLRTGRVNDYNLRNHRLIGVLRA